MSLVIGAFPDPYPGELLYSVQARYQERLGDWRARTTPYELFGSPHVIASTVFPSHLSVLVARLPARALLLANQEDQGYTAQGLLEAHTLLPYYAPFLPPERLIRVEDDVLGAGGPWAQARIGIKASAVPSPRWLRYCPVCVQEDRGRVGEPYWRREHQVPGAFVCVQHLVWLERSPIRARGQDARHVFVPASRALRVITAPRRVRGSRERDILVALGRATLTLLSCHARPPGLEALRAIYLRELIAQGLASPRGRIRTHAFVEEFLALYPEPLLRLLQCQLTGHQAPHDHWLARLARRPRRAQHPLHHLLIQHFLGLQVDEVLAQGVSAHATQLPQLSWIAQQNQQVHRDVSVMPQQPEGGRERETRRPGERFTRTMDGTFESAPATDAPFGAGPWLCLNPACDQYRQQVVTRCTVRYPASARGRPLGTFACACGFVYKRLGPDSTPEDHARRGAVVAFGMVWERRLEQLWGQSGVSVNALSRQLGVDPLTIKRHARRLGLPLQRAGAPSMGALRLTVPLKGRSPYEPSRADRRQRRAAWRALVKAYPDTSARQLRCRNGGLYTWLYRHDTRWLHGHLPRRASSRSRAARVNWLQRDHDLAQSIDRMAAVLASKHSPTGDKPVRITPSLIGRRLGRLALLQQHLDKLPETAQRLAALCESWEAFAVRRVDWVAAAYRTEGRLPQRWEFIRRAGIDRHMGSAARPTIAAAVTEALGRLKNQLDLSGPSPQVTGLW